MTGIRAITIIILMLETSNQYPHLCTPPVYDSSVQQMKIEAGSSTQKDHYYETMLSTPHMPTDTRSCHHPAFMAVAEGRGARPGPVNYTQPLDTAWGGGNEDGNCEIIAPQRWSTNFSQKPLFSIKMIVISIFMIALRF